MNTLPFGGVFFFMQNPKRAMHKGNAHLKSEPKGYNCKVKDRHEYHAEVTE